MNGFAPAETLRAHRSLLLAMEAVGWVHMLGKCRVEFLRKHGGQKSGYDDLRWFENETPPFPWDDLLDWVKGKYTQVNGHSLDWPSPLTAFLTQHRSRSAGLLGLLQAGHGMASGIEKNLPGSSSKYLGQDATHLWLSSVFGHPRRNLLADPPEILADGGWPRLLAEVRRVLEELKGLGANGAADLGEWCIWRESAVGPQAPLRTALSSTLAETRLPNNDVTLWDQSYVAAALFKSALAGAVVEGGSFPWNAQTIKSTTRWRLLTVGIGADHYEARAVRIGDASGTRLALEDFASRVRRLIEVDLAVGSLLYADREVQVFSFPGAYNGSGAVDANAWSCWVTEQVDAFAQDLLLETPPACRISEPTRSLVPMVQEMRKVRATLAVPVHRPWEIHDADNAAATVGHVCPVCLVRLNGDPNDKQKPCTPCRDRRPHRLDAWLGGELASDTIWISEVADRNDRLALVTLSLDLEPWLDGSRLDSLRTQAVAEWRKHNPTLGHSANPIDPAGAQASLTGHVVARLGDFNKNDVVLGSLQEGYRHESEWRGFFAKIVEDRADAPTWDELDDPRRARWLVHQLFRKLASPGRVHRFWRQAEEFFHQLLRDFREVTASDPDRWRARRLVLKAREARQGTGWTDREVYNGRLGDAPVSLLYREKSNDFLTVCNLARVLRAEDPAAAFAGREIELRGDDAISKTLQVARVSDDAAALGTYHPVIPLALSPTRFRVLLPLEAAPACVDRAIAAWNEEFARVWDRLPLRAGIVAFPRVVPFQSVVEAARDLEHDLDDAPAEQWRVVERDLRDGVVALHLARPDGGRELRTLPVTLPDARLDAFYPYLRVADRDLRTPLDFRHPKGDVYRHAADLRAGDGVTVEPARVATLFLQSTGARFERDTARPLADWARMRAVWQLVEGLAPSRSALRGAWAELVDRRESWCGPDGAWLAGGREAWLGLVRAVLHARLDARAANLEQLVEAADDGVLGWSLDWHLSVFKQAVQEAAHV